MAKCTRCRGKGFGPWFMDGGRCHRCGGSGIEPRKQKVYIYQVIIDDGHSRPGRSQVKTWLERNEEGLTMEQALEELIKMGYKPYNGVHGGSGILKVVSVQLVNVCEKLILVK